MKKLSLVVGAWLLLCPAAHLAATSTNSSYSTYNGSDKLIGNFKMVAFGRKNSVGLSNNLFYRPTSHEDAKLIRNWLIDERIRVLYSKDWDRYVLINLDRGESIKTKIYSWG